jgi:hypothetical protein
MKLFRFLSVAWVLPFAISPAAAIDLVSRPSSGQIGDGQSWNYGARQLSADGRFVTFA